MSNNTIVCMAVVLCAGLIWWPKPVKKNPVIQARALELSQETQPGLTVNAEPNEKDVLKMLEHYNVKYPHIVLAQAKLETGHFSSSVCKNNHNLFGLYDSKRKRYFKFESWVESILGYMNMVQYKYHGGLGNDAEYYQFLEDMGYAEDPLYVSKLKRIVKRHETRNR